MSFPTELLYTKDHEWARVESDGNVTIGITDHAQDSLGEIVYVDLPKTGRDLKTHETFGVVESIKAVSDLFSPISGKVVTTNADAASEPSTINKEPYTSGWLIKLQPSDKNQLKELMTVAQYKTYVEGLK